MNEYLNKRIVRALEKAAREPDGLSHSWYFDMIERAQKCVYEQLGTMTDYSACRLERMIDHECLKRAVSDSKVAGYGVEFLCLGHNGKYRIKDELGFEIGLIETSEELDLIVQGASASTASQSKTSDRL